MLRSAAEPGPLRRAGVALAADPTRPPPGSLHSREKRFLQAARFGLPARLRTLDRVLGTDDPEARWLGWLVHCGFPAPDGFEPAVDLPYDPDDGFDPVIAAELRRSLGDALGAFLAASAEPGPVTIRANRARTSREVLAVRLRQQRVRSRPGHAPDALILDGHPPLEKLAAWRDGWFEIQDDGSQQIAALVPRGRVLDLCAGAGGKALQLAARGDAVTATDVRGDALDALRERAARAGAAITVLEPGMDAGEWPVVLVDAPCSGTGRLRREPWLRCRLDGDILAEKLRTQAAILDRAAARAAPGGALVYATCSVLTAENDDQVAAFLRRHPDFAADGPPLRVGPHTHETDGFYAARLTRPRP
jgi:16S rRNA (cytosine967-C5)-methyltransferase